MKDKRKKKNLPITKTKLNRKLYLGRKPKLAMDRNKKMEKI